MGTLRSGDFRRTSVQENLPFNSPLLNFFGSFIKLVVLGAYMSTPELSKRC